MRTVVCKAAKNWHGRWDHSNAAGIEPIITTTSQDQVPRHTGPYDCCTDEDMADLVVSQAAQDCCCKVWLRSAENLSSKIADRSTAGAIRAQSGAGSGSQTATPNPSACDFLN